MPDRLAEKEPRTRIALLNLTYVLKNYKKSEAFQAGINRAALPFQESDRELKGKAKELVKQMEDRKLGEMDRGELSKKLKHLEAQIQDNNDAAKAFLGKKGEQQMKILDLDIIDATQRHARAHGFDLVLHDNDDITRGDFLSAPT